MRQDAVLLAWPNEHTDWARQLTRAQAAYRGILDAIGKFQAVVLLVPDTHTGQELERQWNQPHSLTSVVCEYDDTWVRDSGPISALDASGHPLWLDFRFNGWGNKFAAQKDDRIVSELAKVSIFRGVRRESRDWILEGGAIEVNGAGSVLTTASVFRQRYPGTPIAEIAERLLVELGCNQVLMLDHGDLEGDDTDGHIDTLARFCTTQIIAYQGCPDASDDHFDALQRMRLQLESFRDPSGNPFDLVELPWPTAKFADGHRLPAGYANFLILNDAVIVPTYDDPADAVAIDRLRTVFPSRFVVGVRCLELIRQGGSLHCATMQLASGALTPNVQTTM